MNNIIKSVSVLLKVIYIIPFLVIYLIIKRKKQQKYKTNKIFFLLGFFFTIFNILFIVILHFLGPKNVFNDVNYFALNLYQFYLNIIIVMGYFFLMLSSLKLINKKMTTSNYLIFLVFFLFIIISIFASDYLLVVKLNIITYFTSILFLVISLLFVSVIVKSYSFKGYVFSVIGSFLLLVDPFFFMKTFINPLIIKASITSDVFIFNRFVSFLCSSIGMIFILIPNLRFTAKLVKQTQIKINKSDSLIETTIKKLYNKIQEIYGDVTIYLYKNAFKKSNLKFNDSLTLKGINYAKQKELLDNILEEFNKFTSPDLTYELVRRIINNKNKKLLNPFLKSIS